MSFQGTAPLVSPSELTYFPALTQPGFNFSVASGLLSYNDTTDGSYQSIFSVNASGAETDNVYTGMAVGNVSGGATAIFVGFALDATHFLTASPGSFSDPGFLNRAEFLVNNGSGQQQFFVNISPHVPYDTSAHFLTQYLAISGTVASVYAINQSTGLLALLASQDVSSVVSAATLQTWSAGMYFAGFATNNVDIKSYRWGPISDLSAITVPNVLGDTQATAVAAITALNLTVGSISFGGVGTPGTVTAQSPAGGTLANVGDPVNITIALPPTIQVYGKFIPAKVFPPVMLLSSGLIEPRVWMPKENITVKT